MDITTLRNGMRIVTERMAGIESAAAGVWVNAGARAERTCENGIAHFLEHMAFKGTKRRSARRIAEEIENVGGHINACTGREGTGYYVRTLGEHVGLGVEILADILRNSVFAPEEIARERGVILQEIGQISDTPDDVIFDWLTETGWPDQPLGRPVLGTAANVARFGRDDFQRFIATHYRPGSMILAAAGKVDHDSIARQAEALFGDLEDGQTPGHEPARHAGGERREMRPLEQAHLAVGFAGPGLATLAECDSARIFACIVGGGAASRLFQEIREKRGLCYSIFAHYSAWSDVGELAIYAGTGEARAPELMRHMADLLREACGDISEADIARARAQWRAGLAMGLESPAFRAGRMARELALFGHVASVEDVAARLSALTPESVGRAGWRMISGKPALALCGAIARADNLDSFALRLAA